MNLNGGAPSILMPIFYLYLLLTHLWINDTQKELLFLGALGGWKVSGQEAFERVCDLASSNGSDVLQGLLGGGEWLVSGKLDHLAESLDIHDGLLDLGKLTTCFVELLLLEDAVTGSGLVQNKQLGHVL